MLSGAAMVVAALAGIAEGPVWQWSHGPSAYAGSPLRATSLDVRPGEPFARLRIPKIGLDLTVIEGTRPQDLRKAPGHVSGSGVTQDDGNCIIAGHRDLHFRQLGTLEPGDTLQLEKAGRNLEYRVETTRVVSASETRSLAPSPKPLLTLVTCYPFRFVGPAPQRYLVQARLEQSPAETLWR